MLSPSTNPADKQGGERQLQCNACVYAEPGSETSLTLEKALAVMMVILQANGRWVRYALAHEATDGKPGDCLFVPPACLMDLDERDAGIAKQWKLALGQLTNPDDGSAFLHCWLEFVDAAVSVSNLKHGYPAYARTKRDYYRVNGLIGEPSYVSVRALRVAGRRLGAGPALAKWLAARAGEE